MSIGFDCTKCGKHFQVKDELAGRRARCSGCKEIIRVPEPVAVATDALASDDREYRLASLLDDELGFAPQPKQAIKTDRQCPACAAPLGKNAILCIECGFHLKRGKKISRREPADPGADVSQTAPGSRSLSQSKKSRSKRSGFNFSSYIRGAMLSLVFALVGGGLWATISLATDYSLGFLIWAIGGFAGLGMAMVHQDDHGTLAGITAAVMALVGCVFGKAVWLAFYLGVIGSAIEMQDTQYVAEIVAEEAIRLEGMDPEEIDEPRYDAELVKADRIVQSWNEEQVAARIELYEAADRGAAYQILFGRELSALGKKLKDLDRNEAQGIYEKTARQVSMMSDQALVDLLGETNPHREAAATEMATAADNGPQSDASIFSIVMVAFLAFGLFGGVFLVLAMVTAYRVGASRMVA